MFSIKNFTFLDSQIFSFCHLLSVILVCPPSMNFSLTSINFEEMGSCVVKNRNHQLNSNRAFIFAINFSTFGDAYLPMSTVLTGCYNLFLWITFTSVNAYYNVICVKTKVWNIAQDRYYLCPTLNMTETIPILRIWWAKMADKGLILQILIPKIYNQYRYW